MIPRRWVSDLTSGINAISDKAHDALEQQIRAIDLTQDVATVREKAIAVMQGVCGVSAQGAAMLSTQFYDSVRQLEVGSPLGSTPDSGREPKATEGAVRAFAQKLVDGKQDEFVEACLQRADYEIKTAAAQACLNNAKRDPLKPRFARVPDGEETCDFCLMLASRGFVYHTEAAASHTHSGCNCRVVPSWDDGGVEGYDEKSLYDQWQDAINLKASDRAERNGTTADEERQKIMDGYAKAAAKAHGRSYSSSKPYRPEKSKKFVPDDRAKKQAGILLRGLAKKSSVEDVMEQIIKAQRQWDKSKHSVEMDNYFAERVRKAMVQHGLSITDIANYENWLLKMW